MSALEQGTIKDRRACDRLRVDGEVPVLIGRGDGVLIDLSMTGAKIRHSRIVRRGATTRVSIEWKGRRFSAAAEVLASHVAILGKGTTYESRLRFASLDHGASSELSHLLDELAGRDTRRWVANLRGWDDEPTNVVSLPGAGSYFRCRLNGLRWEVKCGRDATQPSDGFTLPATISNDEILTLCGDYLGGTDEERETIRLLATTAVEQAALVATRARVFGK